MDIAQLKIGSDLLDSNQIVSVTVAQELNTHWTCTVVCRRGVNERIPFESYLGAPLQLSGIDESGTEAEMFSGFVLSADLIYEAGGAYTAHVTAITQSYKMDIAPAKRYFVNTTLAAVAQTMASGLKLTATVDAPAQKSLNYVQYGETDFSFLTRVVDDYAAWMRPTPTGIEVHAKFQPGATVQWRTGTDLIDFRLSGTLAPASFSGSHYDHHVMQSENFAGVTKTPQFYGAGAANLISTVEAKSASTLPSGFLADRSRIMEVSVFKETLEDEAERSIGGSIFGSGRTRNPRLMPGNELTIAGPMDAAGTYGLIKVTQQWDAGGYSNSFVCTPWKDYRNPQAPALRMWNGVVSARVVAHNDPKKMGRIQVQYFWQEDNSTHWARFSAPHAGPDRGFMFMPEVGDEVAVAFEDGDPERPVILGALWNGKQTQPRADLRGFDIATNDVKRIITKSGNRLQLSDKKGVETIVIATPNNSTITLTEQADNTKRQAITIESKSGDIFLHAPQGRVHIEALYYSKDIGPPPSAADAAAAGAAGAEAGAAAAAGSASGGKE